MSYILQVSSDGSQKSYSLDDHGFKDVFDTMNSSGLRLRHNEQDIYRLVSYVYSGVHRRSNTISTYPVRIKRNGRDMTDSPALQTFRSVYKKVMYQTEMSLCTFGRAYWLEQSNGALTFPYWASPVTVLPIQDPSTGKIYRFDRYEGGTVVHLSPEEITPIFLPSLTEEDWYGVSPVQNAMAAGNVLLDIDVFSSLFFNRGAIKFTLLRVSGNPDKQKLSKLESWWKSIASGVQRAFETVLLRDNVEPMVIGDGLKDIDTEKVMLPRREDICVALGVPRSLVDPSAANFATAQQDHLNFYEQTITPQLELILDTVNPAFFEPLGFLIEPDHGKLEAYQRKQLEITDTVIKLYEADLIKFNECRAMLDLDEEEGGDLYASERKREMAPPPPPMIPGVNPGLVPGKEGEEGGPPNAEEQAEGLNEGQEPGSNPEASPEDDDEAGEPSAKAVRLTRAGLLEAIKSHERSQNGCYIP